MVCQELLIEKEQSGTAASYDQSALTDLNGERRACYSVSKLDYQQQQDVAVQHRQERQQQQQQHSAALSSGLAMSNATTINRIPPPSARVPVAPESENYYWPNIDLVPVCRYHDRPDFSRQLNCGDA